MDEYETGDELKFKCGTIEYARNEEVRSLAQRKHIFCPLTKGPCDTDCICFKKPMITNIGCGSTNFFKCTEGYCNCYMLMGPV